MQICSGMQVGLKRDSSFLLLYCDETILRNYSPLIHSQFIMSSFKDHNHFVLIFIIIYKEKGKTDDLRKLSTQNIIKIRFLLCKFVQACKLV